MPWIPRRLLPLVPSWVPLLFHLLVFVVHSANTVLDEYIPAS
jgi:hypothetical protein